MAQVKLNLLPPPNVDFVTGYPGIPPGPDRPQASVKGAVEVRVPPAGVKAKWVRIELRKVETLPGGGPPNTYHDNVGPSPVPLWTSSDEYSLLRSQDFPFSIRIPESIAPTIALDNKAGIGYELLASVCTKGKRGFLRKAKSSVTSVASPVIIDKHELHSTWPVYCQPERRHIEQDGVALIVERNRTCFGPGDRISVMASVKSDSQHTVILRGFEIVLREATVFRPGLMPGKRAAPLAKQTSVSEHKVPVNQTLYGGTAHTLELACMVPANHTTPTLTSARHIDVTYTLCVRAMMGTGTHVVMDLPIMISNWQREVSFEAISRIGPTPGLSLLPNTPQPTPFNAPQNPPIGRPADAVAATLPAHRPTQTPQPGSSNAFNTMPGPSTTAVDEFGSRTDAPSSSNAPAPIGGSSAIAPPSASASPGPASTASPGRRPGSAGNAGGTNRFTVTNLHPKDGVSQPKRNASATAAGGSSGSTQGKPWMSAAEEKQLYEQARQNVVKVQGPSAAPPPVSSSPPPKTSSPPPGGAGGSASTSSTPKPPGWVSAQEEKRLYEEAKAAAERTHGVQIVPQDAHTRQISSETPGGSAAVPGSSAWVSAQEEKNLYEQARAAVERVHGVQVVSPPTPAPASGSFSSHTRQFSFEAPSTPKPSGAALYAEAIKARNERNASASGSVPSSTAGGSSRPNIASPSKPNAVPHLTAEQEKAALRRYEEAKLAVNRAQRDVSSPPTASGSSVNAPIAYESLFPAAPPQATPPPPANAAPPPFENAAGPNNIMAQISEKDRLKRDYELRDAAALAQQNRYASPPPAAYTSPPPGEPPAAYDAPPSHPPPPAGPPSPQQYASALEEKEAMRRKFELRDAQMAARQNPAPTQIVAPKPQPLAPRSNGIVDGYASSGSPSRSPNATSPPAFRPTPMPPSSTPGPASGRVMTAAEEKALLRAKYEMQDAPRKTTSTPRPPQPQPQPTSSTTNGASPSYSPVAYTSSSGNDSPLSPPPLMPRPPASYIKETQDEDARLSRLNSVLEDSSRPYPNGSGSSKPNGY